MTVGEHSHRPAHERGVACRLVEAQHAAAGPELSDVYRNLTGDGGDPFPFFKRMLDVAFPGMATITSGPNRDDPYPLGLTSIWVDKSTFGRDEVQDAIATSGDAGERMLELRGDGTFRYQEFGASLAVTKHDNGPYMFVLRHGTQTPVLRASALDPIEIRDDNTLFLRGVVFTRLPTPPK